MQTVDRENDVLHIHNLPLQSTTFVGRIKELAELADCLDNPSCRLLTLVGPGGIGKTRLAIEAASRHVESFSDGVFFVALQAVSSPDYIIPAIANALKFQIHQRSDPKEQVLNYLRKKKLLLVIDNFEHLLEGVYLVSDILAHTASVKILVTSREALNLQEEWLWPMPAMSFPENGAQRAHLESYSAVQLFVENARRIRADFSLEKEYDGVAQICALVEGMPLALELAATWVRVLTCEEIAREIQRSLDFLETRTRNVLPRHRSMRVVLEQSWELLEPIEQEVFKQLSVFRGGFTREAAVTVAEASLPIISTLMDKSLLRRDPSGHYDLHELVRQYAEEQLDASADESASARQRHCTFYMTFLQRQWGDLLGSKPKDALQSIEKEIQNVRAAWNWAVEHQLDSEIAKGLDSLWFFYDTRGWYREGEQAFAKAIAMFDRADLTAEQSLTLGRLLARRGVLCNSLNMCNEPRELLQESLGIFQSLDARHDMAFAYTRLGEVEAFDGNFSEAEPYFEHGLALYREVGDRWGEAFALNWLDYDERVHSQEHSYAIFQDIGSLWGIAVTSSSLAIMMVHHEDYDRALKLGQDGFMLCQDIGIRWGVSMSLSALGYVAGQAGRHAEAKWCFEQAMQKGLETQLPRHIREAAYGMAQTLTALGDKDQALDFYAMVLYYDNQLYGKHRWTDVEATLPPEEYAIAKQRSQVIVPEERIKTLLDQSAEQVDVRDMPALSSLIPLPLPDALTERELEILQLVANGKSNRDIAEDLVLAIGTVKWYISQIYSKLGVASRTQAVARAQELGLIT